MRHGTGGRSDRVGPPYRFCVPVPGFGYLFRPSPQRQPQGCLEQTKAGNEFDILQCAGEGVDVCIRGSSGIRLGLVTISDPHSPFLTVYRPNGQLIEGLHIWRHRIDRLVLLHPSGFEPVLVLHSVDHRHQSCLEQNHSDRAQQG